MYVLFLLGARLTKHFIEGLTFNTIRLALIDMRKHNSLKSPLLHPTTNSCVIDTKNVSYFRNSQKFTHGSSLLLNLIEKNTIYTH
jgi:hypothetical protein